MSTFEEDFAFLNSLPGGGPSAWTIEQIGRWTDCRAAGHHQYAQAALRKLLARIAELEAEPRVLGHEDGVDTVEECDGFAVYTGCEGEVADFCAFFAAEEDAEAFVDQPDPEEPERKRVFDPCIVPATLTPQGIVSAGVYDIQNHDQLRARIAAGRGKTCKR